MKDDRIYFGHILEATNKILTYTTAGYENFAGDSKTQDAVIRNFEIIGEAAGKISDVARLQYPEMPWKAVIGLRNILIHDYAGVDLNRVWDIIKNHLPSLKATVEKILHN
ncbi:MAG: hypothetical protein A2Y12_04590 [Planctomycetes bacterium GWF2_42_9]|nr:MAG: hypothetical protein A2Y12_04590 [Planctomycetes bacterium GWF2_42_9]